MRLNYDGMLNGDPDHQMSQQEWRMQFLEHTAQEARQFVTPELCFNAAVHVREAYSSVMLYADLH